MRLSIEPTQKRPFFMNSHDFCRDKLGEFLDQTLDATGREAVAEHLETCADCAQIARELASIRATLRQIAPVAPPPDLRRNVRVALQNERQTRARRPGLGWRLSPVAWSGTLALAAFTLIMLARPFANAPLSLPESASVPATAAPEIQSANPPTADASLQKAPRANQKPAPVSQKTGVTAATKSANDEARLTIKKPTAARRDKDLAGKKALSAVAAQPLAAQPPTPRLQDDVGAPPEKISIPAPARPQSIPSAPRAAPNSRFAKSVSRSPSRKRTTARTTPESQIQSRFRSNEHASAPDTTALQQSPFAADGAPPSLFSLQLSVAPAKSGAPTRSAKTNAFELRRAMPDAQNGAFRSENSSPSDESDAASTNSLAGSPALGAMREPPRLSAPQTTSKYASQSPVAEAESSPKTRRFELQLRALNPVQNARVRLEVPPALRLLWPASGVIWSGDLASSLALKIPFSLGEVRGGEKIIVVVEQKTVGAPSRTLETQTLILPATNSE